MIIVMVLAEMIDYFHMLFSNVITTVKYIVLTTVFFKKSK